MANEKCEEKGKKRFPEDVRLKCLLWSDRHCCLCGKACVTNIEIHHIEPRGEPVLDNAIPLCFDCHAEVERYRKEVRMGSKFKPDELKARREQIYDRYTSHLVPPIDFEVAQELRDPSDPLLKLKRKLPDLGFRLSHLGSSLPVKVLVDIQILFGNKKLQVPDVYSGKIPWYWHMNPKRNYLGHFTVAELKDIEEGFEDLRAIVKITIIDRYERPHELLPFGWKYSEKRGEWVPDAIVNRLKASS